MSICLKKIQALQNINHHHHAAVGKMKLLDATWVWTEPHSMRLKVRVQVQTDVLDATLTIQQRVVVEIVIRRKQCPDCNREFTNQLWSAIVQVRQKRPALDDHGVPKGLMVLEMALAKAKHARRHILDIKTLRNGFDFYFSSQDKAQHFASFISKFVPMRTKTTSKLVSTDNHSNTANIKNTVVCDMVPLCRDDLIIADRRAKDGGAGRLSGRLALVNKVSSVVHLVDAAPLRDVELLSSITSELVPEKYWKSEKYYRLVLPPNRMVKFVVLDIELCDGDDSSATYSGLQSGLNKYALADVEVAREADFGRNDETFRCVTHLGNLLNVGDYCMGYDLTATMTTALENMSCFNKGFDLPDIVLVKKVQGVVGADEVEDASEDIKSKSNKLERSKSSRSKKKEKRRKKEEAKERAYQETVARMGFMDDMKETDVGEEEHQLSEAEVDRGRADFERQLLSDPELAEELEMAGSLMNKMALDDIDENK